MDIPVIKVGIIAAEEISFTLDGDFLIEQLSIVISGFFRVKILDMGIYLESGEKNWICPDIIRLCPLYPETSTFTLHQVTIGINFHWERNEDQVFKGSLFFKCDENKVQAINVINIEDYLLSVISSEMSATSSLEFLKAHAVISRSWLLAQIQKSQLLDQGKQNYQTTIRTHDELIKWYDREDHIHFDVCADDHCQRYQGITRAANSQIEEALRETRGEVLTFNGLICDARFSKCCGGVTEIFENVWEPVTHPYLQMLIDNNCLNDCAEPDLSREEAAAAWITSEPDVFCNTTDMKVLRQVLNDYDQETHNFFRWKVVYSQTDLSQLIKKRSGIDFGCITDLIPVERGVSGRVVKLKIVGTLHSLVIGKELEIRKTLSPSHLLSSAFTVEKLETSGDLFFVLNGAGWGHGVGLCQIGAAVMGDRGFRYTGILSHYFRGANLQKNYGVS